MENFAARHGTPVLTREESELVGRAPDTSWFRAALPFDRAYEGDADAASFLAAADPPDAWGVLLVRKGGFAVARVEGATIGASKVGQRHVQGRTKAGGQSQQRFARRRANQASQAYAAAADHAARVLGTPSLLLVTGGDRTGVADVLADRRLQDHRVVGPWLPVPDPRRATLEAAVAEATCLRVTVGDATRSDGVR